MVAVSHAAATCSVRLLAAVAPSRKVTELTAGQRQKRVPRQSRDHAAVTPYDTLTAKSLSRRGGGGKADAGCGLHPEARGCPPSLFPPEHPVGRPSLRSKLFIF